MGTKASARLVGFSLIILCLIFTLCQLGSGVTYQSTNRTLPDEEASAVNELVTQLDSDSAMSLKQSYCNESSYDGIDGITCDCNFQNGCHITEIKLRARGLSGYIPEKLASLTYLKTLDLSRNQLIGSIPASLGNLSSLNVLKLSANQLTGPIPTSLGNMKFKVFNRTAGSCTRMSPCDGPSSQRTIGVSFQLDLSFNQLNGSIPATLGNVAVSSMISDQDAYKLFKSKPYDNAYVYPTFYLYLSNNQLTGTIPESLGNLTFASGINLGDNFLKGSIPASLGKLTNLVLLRLHDNGISGTLPQALGNLKNLMFFDVASNNITGTLPRKSASLTSLYEFSVAGNYLSGPLPDFIANWAEIFELSLNGNNFREKIPAGIFNISNLRIL